MRMRRLLTLRQQQQQQLLPHFAEEGKKRRLSRGMMDQTDTSVQQTFCDAFLEANLQDDQAIKSSERERG